MSKILFYSPYCNYSTEFIKLFSQSPHSTECYYIDVKKDKRTKRRHPYVYKYGINEVPTLIMGNEVLSGTELFTWLNQNIRITGISTMDTRIYGREEKIIQNKTKEIEEKVKKVNIDEVADTKKSIKYEYIEDVVNHNISTPDAEQMVNPETGQVVYAGKKKTKHYDKDQLKRSQLDNEYHQLLREREEQNQKIKNS